jgi:hypothetical protein
MAEILFPSDSLIVEPSALSELGSGFFVATNENGQLCRVPADLIGSSSGQGGSLPYVLLRDVKSTGTDGGTSTTGRMVRDLNEETFDTDDICALASNQFTLPAGVYRINAGLPFWRSGLSRGYLHDVDASTDLLLGESIYNYISSITSDFACVRGLFTLTSETTLEMHQYFSGSGFATYGLGLAVGVSGENEYYSYVELWKLE